MMEELGDPHNGYTSEPVSRNLLHPFLHTRPMKKAAILSNRSSLLQKQNLQCAIQHPHLILLLTRAYLLSHPQYQKVKSPMTSSSTTWSLQQKLHLRKLLLHHNLHRR